MTKTIGNPLSWGARNVEAAGHGLSQAARHAGGDDATEMPTLKTIGWQDIRAALRLGLADFAAFRTDVMAACLLYPVIGACLIWFASHPRPTTCTA